MSLLTYCWKIVTDKKLSALRLRYFLSRFFSLWTLLKSGKPLLNRGRDSIAVRFNFSTEFMLAEKKNTVKLRHLLRTNTQIRVRHPLRANAQIFCAQTLRSGSGIFCAQTLRSGVRHPLRTNAQIKGPASFALTFSFAPLKTFGR